MIILQLDSNAILAQGLFVMAIIVGFFLLLFLIMRAIMLWYWKVDVIVNNQLKQISMLHDIAAALKKISEKNS